MLHTQLDNAREIDAVMPTYNFIEYSDSYSKISGSLGIWTSDEPVLYNNSDDIDFHDNNTIELFKFKEKINCSSRYRWYNKC